MENSKTFMCIDLKSFYASVECAERGLDPFTTNLVVADPTRSRSTICLAITPAMKKLGVKNRCRLHEIPAGIEYITAMPRMQLYIDYSSHIYEIYLRYISMDDIHVYSIDECFMDISDYLTLYRISAVQMAVMLMDAVKKETGITATAGIGTNLYLAKIAMDIVAKHSDDHIGILDEISYRKLLWNHRPLRDFWRTGPRTEKKLASAGIYTMGDIAKASIESEDMLYKMFGIDAELLIDHAWGTERCTISDIKNYHCRDHSLSNGQILMRNYSFEEASVIICEMADVLSLDLVAKSMITDSVTLCIAYDHKYGAPPSCGTAKLSSATNSSGEIIKKTEKLYNQIADRHLGIRRIEICANHIVPETYLQYDIFNDPEKIEKEKNLQKAIIGVKRKYGKNAVVRGISLLDCSTMRERNRQIGGHRA